jgi:hypothetical protein
MTNGGTLYFVHPNHLETPQTITDAGRAVVYDAAFRPFGETETIAIPMSLDDEDATSGFMATSEPTRSIWWTRLDAPDRKADAAIRVVRLGKTPTIPTNIVKRTPRIRILSFAKIITQERRSGSPSWQTGRIISGTATLVRKSPQSWS